MSFGLLGPLVVRRGETLIPIRRGHQRAVLAALLLDANRVVSVDRITEALWGPAPPPSAAVTIRNYIRRLRQALGEDGPDRIRAQPRGYLIHVHAGELDVSQFEALLGAARTAARNGVWDTAAERARAALALWRGAPLADVESDVLAAREGPWLTELQLQAVETRIDADLRLGRHDDVTAELERLVVAHPLREQVHALLMRALYRSGRRGDALAAYQRAHEVLAAELGIEPGPELRDLQRHILAGDAMAVLGTANTTAAVPRQLPAAVPGFSGRTSELAMLTRLLAQAEPTVVISAIGGTAGVGKTALAVHWAHLVADQFPDGQLYVNLRGFDPSGVPVPAAAAMRGFLAALGVAAEQIPAGLDAQAGLFRSLVAGRRMLMVLDNARDAAQVRPLLPGSAGCLVLVTSRSELAGLAALEAARSLRLGLLPDGEARALLGARLGAARLAAEPDGAGELVRLCAGLPLALVIAAARVAARPALRLDAFAAELADARSRLDALDAGDEQASLRAVFSWSAGSLTVPAARMFGLLGVHPGPDITVPVAASLAGVPVPRARSALAELAGVSLAAEHAPGRFSVHDLLRSYATEQARVSGSEGENREAAGRMLDHYLHTACAAARLINTQREAIVLAGPRPGVTPEHLASHQHALSWLEAEHDVLTAAIRVAGEAGFDACAWQLPWALSNFLDWRGYWDQWAATQRGALVAATRLDDAAAQAVTRRLLGQACTRLGDYAEARVHLTACTELCRRIGDQDGEARVHQTLSWLSGLEGGYRSAVEHTEQALALYRASGNRAGQASALNNAGYAHVLLGDARQGRASCQQALAIHTELGNLNGQANAWHSIGFAEYHLGELSQATRCYHRALGMYQELGRRHPEAGTLADLGDALDAAGDPDGARDAWQRAAGILDDLEPPEAARVRAKLRRLGARGRPPVLPQW